MTSRHFKLPELKRFRDAVAALTDEVLDEIAQATPAAWQLGLATGKLVEIMEVMRRRRDAIDRWLPQVETWLSR